MKTNQLITALALTSFLSLPTSRGQDRIEEDVLRDNDVFAEQQARSYAAAAAVDAKRDLERSVKDVERQVKLAQAQVDHVGPIIKRALGATYVNQMDPPLIVATKAVDAAALSELREDLAVLGKLVNDAVTPDRGDAAMHRAMGIVVNWLPGGAATANLYIQGHGAIVNTAVRFPLAPPKKEETSKAAETPKNSAWESARRELFGGENEDAEVVFPQERHEEYDADRVEALKNDLLKALANSSNFRRLDNDETVTAVVRSRTGSRSQVLLFKSNDGINRTQPASSDSDGTMTICVKKTDANALAAGKITEDEFRKRAKVAIY